MSEIPKGKSPFNPGQPVGADFFTGRDDQINKIIHRGVAQVAEGKPISIFVQGEYGIGKTSVAGFAQRIADMDYGLHSVYATLGACENLNDVAQAVLVATLRSGAFNAKRFEIIKNWLANYIGKHQLFGFSLNLDALKHDAPTLSNPNYMLDFLAEVRKRLLETGIKGVFLVLDEINGMTSDPQFANFIKGLVDTNAMQQEPVPLLLMLCGVEEKRREMIKKHQPIERIFDIIEISTMTDNEMHQFFEKAFSSVQMQVDKDAMDLMLLYSAGFPKIMHLVGDAAFWRDDDGVINKNDAIDAVLLAAEDFGKRFIEQQVYKALQSRDYLAILDKIAVLGPDIMSFKKSEIASGLTESQEKKFNNFLQKMKRLKVLRPGATSGQYIFASTMARLYIWSKSFRSRLKIENKQGHANRKK